MFSVTVQHCPIYRRVPDILQSAQDNQLAKRFICPESVTNYKTQITLRNTYIQIGLVLRIASNIYHSNIKEIF